MHDCVRRCDTEGVVTRGGLHLVEVPAARPCEIAIADRGVRTREQDSRLSRCCEWLT